MIKMSASPNLAEAERLWGLLEGQAIPCILRNQHTSSLANGRVPFPDNWPEVWVLRESDADAARLLLDTPAPAAAAWRCPRCGEGNEGHTACWRCSQNRPLDGAQSEVEAE